MTQRKATESRSSPSPSAQQFSFMPPAVQASLTAFFAREPAPAPAPATVPAPASAVAEERQALEPDDDVEGAARLRMPKPSARKRMRDDDDDSDSGAVGDDGVQEEDVTDAAVDERGTSRAFDATSSALVLKKVSDYRNFDEVAAVLRHNCPNLRLVTTKEEYESALRQPGLSTPCFVKITMTNSDDIPIMSSVSDFISRHNKGLTNAERKAIYKNKSIKNDSGRQEREDEAFREIQKILDLGDSGLQILCFNKLNIEHTRADGYIRFGDEVGDLTTRYAGVQMTRLTFETFGSYQTMTKSSTEILSCLRCGFVVISVIFVQNEFCGAWVWTPSDITFFEQIGFFKHINFYAFSKRKRQTNSLSALMDPYLFLWHRDKNASVDICAKKAFAQKLIDFARDANQKYTLDEFCSQLSNDKKKEKLYLDIYLRLMNEKKPFMTCNRVVIQKGDVELVFSIEGKTTTRTRNEAKLCCRKKFGKVLISNLRANATEPMNVNDVGIFTCVVTSTDSNSEAEKIANADIYKYYILIPTRTRHGTLNIRPDNPNATSFNFSFDRNSKKFSLSTNRYTKQIKMVDQDVIVLEHRPDEPSSLTSEHVEKMYEWATRPLVDMEAIIRQWYDTCRDNEQKARQTALKDMKARKRMQQEK